MDRYNAISLLGIFLSIVFACLFSTNRRPINWQIVIRGVRLHNIIPRIIKAFMHLFTKLMNVSGTESLYAASSIFAGVFSSTILSCSADTGEMALDSAG